MKEIENIADFVRLVQSALTTLDIIATDTTDPTLDVRSYAKMKKEELKDRLYKVMIKVLTSEKEEVCSRKR